MPGPYDFTVRNRSFVGMIGSCCDRLRPPRPALNVRDDREAPLLSSTGPNQHSMISEKWKQKIWPADRRWLMTSAVFGRSLRLYRLHP